MWNCPCLSFRLYIKCCTVCSRFTFVCNLPSLHITSPTLVTHSVWTKLHLHVLPLCSLLTDCRDAVVCHTNLVSNQSLCTDVRRNLSAMAVVGPPVLPPWWILSCLYLCLAWEIRRSQWDIIVVGLNSPLLWGLSGVYMQTSLSPLPPCLVIWLKLYQWIWAVFTGEAFISVLAIFVFFYMLSAGVLLLGHVFVTSF